MDLGRLQEKVKEGQGVDWSEYGDVRAIYLDDLVLFSYTQSAQYEGRWNDFERMSRGLILNWKTGEIVARPFDKFFNWLENGEKASGHIVNITEKVDGSLGILYRHNGGFKVATRGSFDGEQATWATDFLNANYPMGGFLPNEYTLLFEIVYPENRIVVDYGHLEELFLLAARNRFTGEYLPFFPDVYEIAQEFGFPLPQVYDFNRIEDIIAATDTLSAEHEGWVVEFSRGQRFKFKGDRYKELHRIVTNASLKRVVESIRDGRYYEMIAGVPDEFLRQIKEWKQQVDAKVQEVRNATMQAFDAAPKETRKEFALWSRENHPNLMPYLFLMLDDRPIEPTIYKKEF
jgi:RNA ligase